ncbi:MAG TPA: efflux RND transporter periplasmic adaptor subunit [Caulobacteraceae bacterium]|jgi:RND family efflux transporter MFP subunit
MQANPEALLHRSQPWLKPLLLGGAAVAVLIVAFGVVTRGMASTQLKTKAVAESTPTVDVISPAAGHEAETLTLPGEVQATNSAVIHARVGGYLKRWTVDIGAPVKAGQLLAEIDTPELDQQLAQAKAHLATTVADQKFAQTTSARWSRLLGRDAVSHQEADEKAEDLEAKTTLVEAAKADVDRLEALQSFKRIVAPFDGFVTARTTDIGALITTGGANDAGLFTVSDVRRLRIYVHVPQSYSAAVGPGATAHLSVPEYPGRTFDAKLVSTSGAVGAQSGSVLVELQMDNPQNLLKPGEYAQVQFILPPAPGVVQVPASALMFRQKGMAVAVVDAHGRAAMRYIKVQRDLGSAVEVASGLSATDRVINNPPDSLSDGEAVRVAARSRPGQAA